MASIETAYGDYKDLVKGLADGASKDTIYEEIMAKEQNRIDLINRVVTQKQEAAAMSSLFYNNSLLEIAIAFAQAWRAIFTRLVVEKAPATQWQGILYDGDRKIYVGMMLVLVALFLYFVDASS